MDALIQKLNARLRKWNPETAAEVSQQLTELIELADRDALDLMRSRAIEQPVLNVIDRPTTC